MKLQRVNDLRTKVSMVKLQLGTNLETKLNVLGDNHATLEQEQKHLAI